LLSRTKKKVCPRFGGERTVKEKEGDFQRTSSRERPVNERGVNSQMKGEGGHHPST